MNTSVRKSRLAKKMRGKAPEVVINPMTTSNNIVIIPVWGRLYPLERHVNETSRLFNYLYVVSPEDVLLDKVLRVLEGSDFIVHSNEYPSLKINAGINHTNHEWVINCGSDDILYDDLFHLYSTRTDPFMAVNNRDIDEGGVITNMKYPLGAGRRIHRSLLGEDIYPPCHKGMDGKSGKNVKENLIVVDCDTPMLKSIYTNEHITEKWW